MKKTVTILSLAAFTGLAAMAMSPEIRERSLSDPANAKRATFKGKVLKSDVRKSLPQREDAQTISYGYCGEPSFTFGVAWQEYTALVEFPEEFTNTFEGAEIIGVQVASPDNFENPEINNFTSIDLGFYEEKDGEPFYCQKASLSSVAFEWNEISLDSPIKIEKGKPFFVGYSGIAPSIDDSCFAVDFNFNSDNVGLWLGWVDEFTGEKTWEPYTEWYGNLCLRLVIKATNLPSDMVNLENVYLPGYVRTGEPFDLTVAVSNTAYNAIESFTFQYSAGGEVRDIIVEPTPAIPGQMTAEINVPGLVCEETGVTVPLEYKITAVNGNVDAVITDTSDHDTHLLSLPDGVGYERSVVVEEGTGTWCGYCPLGIVGMDYMAETYTDGTFIPVAVHYNDPMESSSYVTLANEYFSSYPSALVNRDTYRFGVIQPEANILQFIYEYVREIPAYADIDMDVNFTDESEESLTIKTTSRFAIPSDKNYRIEIALTENNVGPYPQTNYFADNAEGPMGGFEELPSPVSLKYNFVARTLEEITSLNNVKPGEDYEATYTLPADALKDKADFSVIAMIVNEESGEIENAVMKKTSIQNGINEVSDTPFSVKSGEGYVSIASSEGISTIYSLDGSEIAKIEGSGTISMPKGAYLVTNGLETRKVIVR